jgi:hypothetical protein
VIALDTYGGDAGDFFEVIVKGCSKSWGKWTTRISADNFTI